MFNADANEVSFRAPAEMALSAGDVLINTSQDPAMPEAKFDPRAAFVLAGRALALVRFARKLVP
jgi:hypothetical protein